MRVLWSAAGKSCNRRKRACSLGACLQIMYDFNCNFNTLHTMHWAQTVMRFVQYPANYQSGDYYHSLTMLTLRVLCSAFGGHQSTSRTRCVIVQSCPPAPVYASCPRRIIDHGATRARTRPSVGGPGGMATAAAHGTGIEFNAGTFSQRILCV